MKTSPAIRLQKYIAATGICSRRAAEELIASGAVTVNGKTAEPGLKVIPGKDRVFVGKKPLEAPADEHLTLAMNKPRGYICSHADPHNEQTIFDLLPAAKRPARRLLYAGRLDKDSEGLVILTTDGDLVNRLTHPRSGITKRYNVLLSQPFPAGKIPALLRGVQIEGERLNADKVIPLDRSPAGKHLSLEVHLHHGRKREIRRLFEALGFRVKRLQRFQIGNLTVRGIPQGEARPLGPREIRLLLGPSADVPS